MSASDAVTIENTMQDYEAFRMQFRSIVYQKGQVSTHTIWLRKLWHWDKNGSHTNAIKKAEDALNGVKDLLNTKLKGKPYKEWLETSRKLSGLKSRLKEVLKRRDKIENNISALIKSFNYHGKQQ